MTEFIYLHGFASGPNSSKAQAFKKRFEKLDITFHIPDLQEGDFENLTSKFVNFENDDTYREEVLEVIWKRARNGDIKYVELLAQLGCLDQK